MIRLRLHTCVHTCVLLASLSNAHHWSEHGGLGRTLFFRSHDLVHFVKLGQFLLLRARHRCQRIHPQSWYWSMFFVNVVEVVLVNGPCELDVDPDRRGSTSSGTGG